jgi:nickel-dependent lactate racemase
MKDGPSFFAMLRSPGFFRVDQWEVEEMVKVLRKASVSLYTEGISKEDQRRCHVLALDSVEHGINEALGRHGPDATITVLPSGPYQMPGIADAACGRSSSKSENKKG